MVLGLTAPRQLSAQIAQGDIDLQSISSNPNNPTGVCQCDTVTVRYELKRNFSPSTEFVYQYALGTTAQAWNAGTTLELELAELWTNNNPITQATSVLDTFNTGLRWARLIIPCNGPIGLGSLRIINRDAANNITANGASDTAFYNVNRIPTIAFIDSIARLSMGMRMDTVDNPYTVTTPDVGMCSGDTIFLRVQNDGTSYQWYNGSLPVGNDEDSLMVTGPGNYYCEVLQGPCSIFSDTVVITEFNTPSAITFDPGNPGNTQVYQADNPRLDNFGQQIGLPLDSIELCESNTAVLTGPDLPAAVAANVTLRYQWLTDSFNPVTGLRDTFAIAKDTFRFITIDETNSGPGLNRYWVIVDDGFCVDTTAEPYFVIRDVTPSADIASVAFPGTSGPTVFNEVCMKDSIRLSVLPGTGGSLLGANYRWQWYDPSRPTNPWRNVSGGAAGFDTLANITIDTSLSDPGQPYFQSPKPSLRFFRLRYSTRTTFNNIETCVSFSDSIAIRWYPEDSVVLAPNQPNINIVGKDSINFCEGDTAELVAPATPAGMSNFGYSYRYQWLSDSVDPNTGSRVRYALANDTLRSIRSDSAGRFFVAIDDGICIDTIGPVRLYVDSIPQTLVQERRFPGQGLTGFNLCFYDSALVSASDTVGGVLPWNYQWQQLNPVSGNWSNLTADTNVTFQIDSAYRRSGEDTAYFRLITNYVNQFGLQACDFVSDSIRVIFYRSPNLSFFPGKQVNLCEGDSVLVVAQGNFNSVSWSNGSVLGATNYIKQAGSYPVEVTGINGCITRDTVIVNPIVVTANAGPDVEVLSGERVTLQATGGTDYRWFANKPIQFSDFLSQSIQVSKVLEPGVTADTVIIYVQVTNTQGCSGLDSLRMIVRRSFGEGAELQSQAYNLFTPNNDGLNDVWDIRELMNGDRCRIQIMNRWGSPVFEDENFSGIWTGVDDGGNDLPDGTYYYVLECNGDPRMRNAVSIIRNQQ